MTILVNFASHPSILGADNLLYSGDYVSYVQSGVEKAYDGEVTAMFCTGAGGDIKIAVVTNGAGASMTIRIDSQRTRPISLVELRMRCRMLSP